MQALRLRKPICGRELMEYHHHYFHEMVINCTFKNISHQTVKATRTMALGFTATILVCGSWVSKVYQRQLLYNNGYLLPQLSYTFLRKDCEIQLAHPNQDGRASTKLCIRHIHKTIISPY